MATGFIDIPAMNSTAFSLKRRVRKHRLALVIGTHHAVLKKKSMGRPVKFFEMDAVVSRMDVRVSSNVPEVVLALERLARPDSIASSK